MKQHKQMMWSQSEIKSKQIPDSNKPKVFFEKFTQRKLTYFVRGNIPVWLTSGLICLDLPVLLLLNKQQTDELTIKLLPDPLNQEPIL